jgi:hypothetical protein
MNTNLLSIVKQIAARYGEEALADPKRLRAFLSDLARDEPKPLRMAVSRCIEEGAYKALRNAGDAAERALCKAAIAQRVRDEHGIDPAFSSEALDILETALFGEGKIPPPPAPPDRSSASGPPAKRNAAPQPRPAPALKRIKPQDYTDKKDGTDE